MSLARTTPMLGLHKSGCAGWFSLLEILNVGERDMLDPSGEAPSLLYKPPAVKGRIGAGTIVAITMR
jgi:hypothetical protein